MTRSRRVLLAVLLVASVALAGCAGSDSSPSSVTTEPTTSPESTTASATTDSTVASPTETSPSRLTVEAHGVENVTVTIWNSSAPEGDPVYDRTFRQPEGTYFLDHVFEHRVSYSAVVRVNGTVVVNRTLHASTGYRVEVTPNGTAVSTVET